MTTTTAYRERLLREINALPEEYMPYLLQLVQTFRDGVVLKPAVESFKQGWREAQAHEVAPLTTLWDGIDDAASISHPSAQSAQSADR